MNIKQLSQLLYRIAVMRENQTCFDMPNMFVKIFAIGFNLRIL